MATTSGPLVPFSADAVLKAYMDGKISAQKFEEMLASFTPRPIPTSPPHDWSPYEKIQMRLNLPRGASFGFDYTNIWEGPGKVFIMICHQDQGIILEDDRNLFPSDSLVAKIQLLRNSFNNQG